MRRAAGGIPQCQAEAANEHHEVNCPIPEYWDHLEARQRFYGTFDPPVVLKMLAVIEDARAVIKWRSQQPDGLGWGVEMELARALAAFKEA
jgi:hypothetical protein